VVRFPLESINIVVRGESSIFEGPCGFGSMKSGRRTVELSVRLLQLAFRNYSSSQW
jgi:hypothetical protein